VVPVGAAPFLPAAGTLRFTDGVTRPVPLRWDAVPPQRYAAPGSFTVAGTVPGSLLRATATVRVTDAFVPDQNIARAGGPTQPTADAGYSGGPNTVPAGLLDGDTTRGWSNFYRKQATNVLPAVSLAHAGEWVSVSWPSGQRLGSVVAYFTTDANRALPATVSVSYWTGAGWAPVADQQVRFATASNQPTTITFAPVSTTAVRLTMTSPAPNTGTGFLQVTELQVPADEVTG
jgi:beta-galactosidase